MILSCLEKKSNDYSLEVQYSLVEEEQKLEVKIDDDKNCLLGNHI